MRLFRKKRGSIDRAATKLVQTAVRPDGVKESLDRPLIVGIGSADFPCNGRRGELAAPTDKLLAALKLAFDRERRCGRVVVVHPLDEFRSTMCCCACGVVCDVPMVRHRRRFGGDAVILDERSGRLRSCTQCGVENIPKLRDRDIQAARNLLWCVVALYHGAPRPEYMDRSVVAAAAAAAASTIDAQ
jgi:hypothetical protein